MKKQGLLLTTLFLALFLTLAIHAETVGRTVSIVLDENPTTGYEWSYAANPEGILKEVSGEYTQNAGTENMMGAGGKHSWTFESVAEGGTVLHFTYARPFEQGVAPARAVSFVCRVDEGLNAFQLGNAEASGGYAFISLSENPTTGYRWVIEPSAPDVLSQESDEYMTNESPEGLVGAGGTHAWRFAAAAPGEVTLSFLLERSFESGVADELHFTFAVDNDLSVTLKMAE